MKKIILLYASLLCISKIHAQADSIKWAKEINEQVWKPFISNFISGNQEGFRDVHSKRVTRVEIDHNVIQEYEKYFPPVNPNSQNKKNVQRGFELRFDKRISNGIRAWESGFYKGTVMEEGKQPRSYYGRFFVVLEKENGIWKILVDADTGKDAHEENFNKAAPLE